DAGIRVSLFIDPSPVQTAVAQALGAPVVELHTGAFCEAVENGNEAGAQAGLKALHEAAADGAERGLEVHAGHGITFDSVAPIAAIPQLRELNIGHFLVGEAIFTGWKEAIQEMRRRMDAARA
ncbi:MAG: pyridoxine 5'-phosphate synthase, partial [Hyphomonadaceae bacterium]